MPKDRNLDALTASDIAELLGCTPKSVRNYWQDNGLPFMQVSTGRVSKWSEVLDWYVQKRLAESGNGGKKITKNAGDGQPPAEETYADALCRKTIADANLRELELAVERGDVVAVADVEKSVANVAASIKTAILALPSKLVTRLHGVSDRNAIRAILDAEAREICSRLAAIGKEQK